MSVIEPSKSVFFYFLAPNGASTVFYTHDLHIDSFICANYLYACVCDKEDITQTYFMVVYRGNPFSFTATTITILFFARLWETPFPFSFFIASVSRLQCRIIEPSVCPFFTMKLGPKRP